MALKGINCNTAHESIFRYYSGAFCRFGVRQHWKKWLLC